MDTKQFDRVSKAFATWLTRRKMLKGIGAIVAGGAVVQGGRTLAQDGSDQDTPTEPSIDAQQGGTYAEDTPTEPDYSDEPTATDTPWSTDTPTPTETPWETETPTETPTEETFPTETPTDEPPPPQEPQIIDANDPRPRIAEICRRASSVLDDDLADPSAYDNHPHPQQAYGFLKMLNGLATQGFDAETWDDDRLNDYVVSADAIALAVRIGADAYYETLATKTGVSGETLAFQSGSGDTKDPDTCIYRELGKWAKAIQECDDDDALCRMSAFWDFTVLNSCRRCLRGF